MVLLLLYEERWNVSLLGIEFGDYCNSLVRTSRPAARRTGRFRHRDAIALLILSGGPGGGGRLPWLTTSFLLCDQLATPVVMPFCLFCISLTSVPFESTPCVCIRSATPNAHHAPSENTGTMPSRAALRPLAAPSLLLLRASAPALPAVPCHQTIPKRAAAHHRPYSSLSSSSSQSGSSQSPPPRTPSSADEMPDPPPSRWYGELHRRIGKCILFGCDPSQVATAGTILGALATEWRSLLAGSEGFLTGARRGLEGQQVVWGEQDSFVRSSKKKKRLPNKRNHHCCLLSV